MNIRLATLADLDTVAAIVQQTIREQYPHYYPAGAVALFLDGHSAANIGVDVEKNIVWLAEDDAGAPIGTITIDGNHLTRLYVLPSVQGRGYVETDYHLMWAENGDLLAYDDMEKVLRNG